jgi:hypothetical protein
MGKKMKTKKYVKMVVFVPLTHSDILRKAIADAGAGNIGNYDYCSFSCKGIGRFRAKEKAKPYIGKINEIEEVEEERIEVICLKNKAKSLINTIRKIHPYEEVILDVYTLINENDL